jgi:uncharacterized membrane protein YebE (DUF533 family)
MEQDPRRLIARLAVAVMTADGRITAAEREALAHLDDLGLGPISGFAEAEIERAMQGPLDIETACSALAGAGPEAAAVILAARKLAVATTAFERVRHARGRARLLGVERDPRDPCDRQRTGGA